MISMTGTQSCKSDLSCLGYVLLCCSKDVQELWSFCFGFELFYEIITK